MRDLQLLITILYEELFTSLDINSYSALPQLNIRTSHE
jgi:hypothetical protein